MSTIPSIEDLLKKSDVEEVANKTETEKTAPEKFQERISEIQLRERENAAQAAATLQGVPYVALRGFAVSPEALGLVPKETAESVRAVPFLFTGPELRLGSPEPSSSAVQELAFQIGERKKTHVGIYRVSEDSLSYVLNLYEALPKIAKIIKGVRITETEIGSYQKQLKSLSALGELLASSNTTDIMTIMIAAALRFESSDIHIEAEEGGINVRFRVDGVLQKVAQLPKESWKKIVSRIKLISGLKINITNRPQDGRFTIFLQSGNTDVRVSSLPTNWGESVVMRILKPSAINVGFEELGFRPKAFEKLERELKKPHGMILTTGPTGSGKTTTLYSMLRKLNQPGVKIITLEDPIEYKLQGINQSQVDAEKTYTFASGLRSILRQDPDIVMVGEIRDLETADTAVNAALTGHLLLSTVHTNDAAGAIPRLMNMGVKPFLLVQALNVILGQRLVRRLCESCKVPVALESDELEEVKKSLLAIPEASGERIPTDKPLEFYGPPARTAQPGGGTGCDKCHGGYKGRVGIYEILVMTPEVETAMKEGSPTETQMREIAQQQGMVTMYQDGLLKALEGITSVEEINRVAMT